MPLLHIATNVSRANIPSNLEVSLAKDFQKLIGKPMDYIAVHIQPDQMMSFGGTDDPCANVHVMSIGKLGECRHFPVANTLSRWA